MKEIKKHERLRLKGWVDGASEKKTENGEVTTYRIKKKWDRCFSSQE